MGLSEGGTLTSSVSKLSLESSFKINMFLIDLNCIFLAEVRGILLLIPKTLQFVILRVLLLWNCQLGL